ncbi:DUF2303 family protein [Methylobacterium sp. CM6244]
MATNNTVLSPSGDAEAIQRIADLSRQGVTPVITTIPVTGLGGGLPSAIPVVVTPGPNGGTVRVLKDEIEKFRTGPERRRGTATVTTLLSFIELVNRHKDDGSVIFAKTDWPKPALTAVLDYHGLKGEPRNADHRVHYAFPITPEFEAWINNAGEKLSQADFAAFLEDHAAELSAPYDAEKGEYERLFKAKFATPNELIDLARSLEIRVGQTFKQAIKLQSGEAELVYQEEHTGRNGEAITVPGIFMIALPAFLDGEQVRIPVRLRYRAGGGTVTWFYDLYRWQDELRDRVSQDLAKAGKETALPTFEGSPETVAR